jgi:hypothetical protein
MFGQPDELAMKLWLPSFVHKLYGTVCFSFKKFCICRTQRFITIFKNILRWFTDLHTVSLIMWYSTVCRVSDGELDYQGLISVRGRCVSLFHPVQASSGTQPTSRLEGTGIWGGGGGGINAVGLWHWTLQGQEYVELYLQALIYLHDVMLRYKCKYNFIFHTIILPSMTH